ncbi:MAG: hypothetical protein AB7I38_01135 [Dehalococcoidia bacterium]
MRSRDTASTQLAAEAQWWIRARDVESVWCWLPTFDQVCDNVHTVTVFGNDGLAVNVVVDNERAARAAGAGGELAQLAHLGRILTQARRDEMGHWTDQQWRSEA